MEIRIKNIVSQMTIEEKAAFCSGGDFFSMKELARFGIPAIAMCDGPHGLRKQIADADFLGKNSSVEATCFPSGATLACSWDRKLMENIGSALGEECQEEDISILLGPSINIKRSPLCGRNFEYLSEDPYLVSELATEYINGLQSQGVGASLKHFAVNNQEDLRLSIDAQVDERTLREIYLTGFEEPVKKAKPWTVMCAYNKVNGDYCSDNMYLLDQILRKEWGFNGFVVSDWGAVADRVGGIRAGLDLQMPPSAKLNDEKIIDAINNGKLEIKDLDKVIERLLEIVIKATENKKPAFTYNRSIHENIAEKAAKESIVLLKNESEILPLNKNSKLCIIGALAKKPRYQGSGSSYVNARSVDNIYEKISDKTDFELLYADGYTLDSDEQNEYLIQEAKEVAKKVDKVVLFVGLPEEYESEGYDRRHLDIPQNQIRLIEEIHSIQQEIVIVLCNGAPIEMPWIQKAKGIVESYLGGQALGGAIADILFGDANPCGKLAETFPEKLSHNPSYLNFPGEMGRVEYKEGIFVGYRYYDKKEIKPLFPFGFGLSYTSFDYVDIKLNKKKMKDIENLIVTVRIKNVGKLAGKEIVQLYVSERNCEAIRPIKELKGFEKIFIEPGEEKEIVFELNKRAFAYYRADIQDWYVQSDDYDILIASSSQDIRLCQSVYVESTTILKKKYSRYSTIGELMDDPKQATIVEELIEYLSGEGGLVTHLKDKPEFLNQMLRGLALCLIYSFSNSKFTEDNLQDILKRLNEKPTF